MFDYTNDTDSVKKLLPFLNQDKWEEWFEKRNIISTPSYAHKEVTQLVQQKCGYKFHRLELTDVRDLMNDEGLTIVSVSSMHFIAFYKPMIFDANNTGHKKATMKNITKYPNFSSGKKGYNNMIGIIKKEINEFVYKFIRPVKKQKRGRREATV